MTDGLILQTSGRAPISDAELDAVREMAAQGRPIPAIIMAAIVERLEAKGLETMAADEVHRTESA